MDFIEASGLSFSQLNETIRHAGKECRICACQGQRFIAAGMSSKRLEIDGIPGNALGAYLGGGSITVNDNAQDAVGDTMSAGRIVIHGSTGDAATKRSLTKQSKHSTIRTFTPFVGILPMKRLLIQRFISLLLKLAELTFSSTMRVSMILLRGTK